MAAHIVTEDTVTISRPEMVQEETPRPPPPPPPTRPSFQIWQQLALVVSKTMIVYCAMSLSILCLLAILILSGGVAAPEFSPAAPAGGEEESAITNITDTTNTTSTDNNNATISAASANISETKLLSSRVHLHDTEFYLFILTVLVSIRGGLLYMGKALKRPIIQKDSSSVGTWLFGALCIVVAELILGLSLLQCLPGAHILILVFLVVEILVQVSFMWIVWNFKLEMIMET